MMKLSHSRSGSTLVLLVACAAAAAAAAPLTLEQVLDIARAKNPSLLSAEQHVDATQAAEITAGLRQNPNFTLSGANITLRANNPAAPIPMRQCVAPVRTRAKAALASRLRALHHRCNAQPVQRSGTADGSADQERLYQYAIAKRHCALRRTISTATGRQSS